MNEKIRINIPLLKKSKTVKRVRKKEGGYEIVARYPAIYTLGCLSCGGDGVVGGDKEKICPICHGRGFIDEVEALIELTVQTDPEGVVQNYKAFYIDREDREFIEFSKESLENLLKQSDIKFEKIKGGTR